MRISVALCTYNGAKYLPELLASVRSQTRLPDELVVCDDGSSDETFEIIESFAATVAFPVQVHRNERNLGSTKNFEKAIGHCTGDVIATADQDDSWLTIKLAAIEDAFSRMPQAGLVFSDALLIDEAGQDLECRLWKSVRLGASRIANIDRGNGFAELMKKPAVTGATMAFRSGFRDLIIPIPDAWIHDEWIAILIAACSRISAIREPLMRYRRHSQNQIGVSGLTIAERRSRSLARPFSEFRVRSKAFAELRKRVAERLPNRPELLEQIDSKIRHFCTRADLPEARILRVSSIFRELITLRYARYSGTAMSSIRDLMARSQRS